MQGGNKNCTFNCLCNKAKCKNKLNVKILVSYMKSFLAYCIFVLQASEVAEAEQVNTSVDPDGEFNKQSSTVQTETF